LPLREEPQLGFGAKFFLFIKLLLEGAEFGQEPFKHASFGGFATFVHCAKFLSRIEQAFLFTFDFFKERGEAIRRVSQFWLGAHGVGSWGDKFGDLEPEERDPARVVIP
jgi:hypothetical protein